MADSGVDIARAAALLNAGDVVAIPTETVYGLAANALNSEACLKIFEAKNRPFFDPLIVHIKGIEEVENYALNFPILAKKVCAKHWPGPLTIILKKKGVIPDLVTAGHNTVALRVPNHPLTLQLLQTLDFPLAAPSANPFGYVSPTTAAHVNNQLGENIQYILDGGPCDVGLESTIVDFSGEKPEILRLGGLDPELLKFETGKLAERLTQNSDPSAPGQLDKHYSPKTRFILLHFEAISGIADSEQTAYIRFNSLIPKIDRKRQFILAEDGDLHSAAQQLFAVLRKVDQMNFTTIVAEEVPNIGLGRAINDRLKRAAYGLNPE